MDPRSALGVAILVSWLVGCAGGQPRVIDDPLGLEPRDSPASLYVQMAEEYYNRGQLEIAFRNAQQALQADASYPKAQIWVAFLYEMMGKLDLASRHYERALGLAPNNADVLYALGAYQCRQGRYDEAERYFQRALDNPLYATPWVALTNAGNCAVSAGDSAKARSHYEAALVANPAFGPALVKLAELESKRDNHRAAKVYLDRYFDPATLRTPAMAKTALLLAIETERHLGQRARAAEYERILRANFPESSVVRTQ
ncbi:MAG: type IV pilus biogenesis/stability protein PilW [Sphingobacteriia bacterium]|nr:type IV pilus biogenesis/stability protein PilW [Sphingobacteriia bacterium]NCC38233.1 type IV pilus biogenesis/stability protein PilW [Gammaproteobacteria bacterium]